jgi:hypothetical protein
VVETQNKPLTAAAPTAKSHGANEENHMKILIATLITFAVTVAPALACCPGCP